MFNGINICNMYPIDGGKSFMAYRDKDFYVINRNVGRCQAFILVWHDLTRAFMAGGEFGYDWRANELDDVAIEALAERFDLAELRQVLSRRSELAATANPAYPTAATNDDSSSRLGTGL